MALLDTQDILVIQVTRVILVTVAPRDIRVIPEPVVKQDTLDIVVIRVIQVQVDQLVTLDTVDILVIRAIVDIREQQDKLV